MCVCVVQDALEMIPAHEPGPNTVSLSAGIAG